MPVEADVESVLTLVETDATLPLVVERPVDSEVTPLCAVLIPDDVEVESELRLVETEATLLLVVDRPVETDATPL